MPLLGLSRDMVSFLRLPSSKFTMIQLQSSELIITLLTNKGSLDGGLCPNPIARVTRAGRIN